MPKLNPTMIAKLAPEGGKERTVSDSESPLAVRVRASGELTYVVRFRLPGEKNQKRITLGPVKSMSLVHAREAAREYKSAAVQGIDLKAEASRKAKAETVDDIAAEWLEQQVSGLSQSRAITAYYRKDVAPAIGKMKVADVRRVDVLKLVEKKAATAPRAAAQVLIYTRQLLEFAANRDLIPANPAAGLKPSAITVAGKKTPLAPRAKERVLDADELKRFWSYGGEGMTTQMQLLLKLICVTGQRPGEVRKIHEDDIEGRWWTVPAKDRGKTNTPNEVYLTDTAMALLTEARAELERLRERRNAPRSGYIFESGTGKPPGREAAPQAVKRSAKALGMKTEELGYWTPHDLRRTMRTGLADAGVSDEVAEVVVGHVKQGVTGVYNRSKYLPRRKAALEAWERRLLAVIEGRDPDIREGNVVALESA